jgi:hypothetical protein
VGPGTVAQTPSGGGGTGTGVKAAATGTLPFTGSDIRAYAILGDLLVLLGFVMLIVTHRSPRMTALMAKITPNRTH